MLLDIFRLDEANLSEDKRSKTSEQHEGIMCSRKIIILSSDETIMNCEHKFVSKPNLTLVEILKKE